MLDRRQFLGASLLGAGSALTPVQAQPIAPPPPFALTAFGSDTVIELAQELSRKPFVPPVNDLPQSLTALPYDQYVGIRLKPGAALWANDDLPFVVEPLHRGAMFWQPVALHVVENGVARLLAYDPVSFDFGRLAAPPRMPSNGYSGIRILRARADGPPVETALFQGLANYRAMARGQTSGVIARALAISVAEPRGEEYPLFRAIWIERPGPSSATLTLHALLDSESVAGAYRFTLRPGDATIVDVEATLFPRVALDHVGVAPMQATALFGPLDRRRFDDARAAVADVSGLQMETGAGEHLWRPVANRESLQLSTFVDNNPRRFGLAQRAREFHRFFDDDQHWELKPTLLIEPIGEWGAGGVQLVEIPADSEVNDNVIAYWRPKATLAAGARVALAYRQIWCWSPPAPPPLAMVTESRSGRASGAPRKRRFFVEFASDIFADPPADIRAELAVNPGQALVVRTFVARERKRLHVNFDIDSNGEPCEMRMLLTAAGKPISETWLYRWTP